MGDARTHKVKASDLVGLRKHVAAKRGTTLDRVRETLTPELRDILDMSLASSWVPDAELCAIYDGFCQVLLPGVAAPRVQLGRQMALMSYTGIYRVFLAVPSAAFVIRKAANVWASYHSTGTASMEDVGDERATLVVRGAACISPCMIDIIAGHILALAELTRAKDPVVVSDASDPSALRWSVRWRNG